MLRSFFTDKPGLRRGILLPLAMLCAALPGVLAQQVPQSALDLPFPKELTSIRIAYVKSLEPVETELRQKKALLKQEYHKALDELGREFVEEKDQAAALAVKIEQNHLKDAGGYYPNADVEGGRRLENLRYRYQDALAEIDEQFAEQFQELADVYLEKLQVWEKIYEERRDRTNAAALRAEIQRIESAISGERRQLFETAKTPSNTQTPPATSVAAAVAAPQAPEIPVGEPVDAPEPEPEQEQEPAVDPATLEGQLALQDGWEISDGPDGNVVKAELTRLLGRFGQAGPHVQGYPTLMLYENVHYLMPLAQTVEKLGLKGRQVQVAELDIPGLPSDSLKTHFYPGRFVDTTDSAEFDGVTLVTDLADQVVCLQLNRKYQGFSLSYRLVLENYEYYDYIYGQKKQGPGEGVWHKLHSRNMAGQYIEEAENIVNPHPEVLRLDSLYFLDNLEVKTMARWYIPRPFVDVILMSSNS